MKRKEKSILPKKSAAEIICIELLTDSSWRLHNTRDADMTIDEITKHRDKLPSPHKPKPSNSPQTRRRQRETDFERNARDIAAKKRALKPKSPL